MKKEEIRKKFFKLKIKGHSYSQSRKLLKVKYNYDISERTLKRWMSRLDNGDKWDLKDKSRKPNKIYFKINLEIEKGVLKLRKKTGWGANKLKFYFKDISETSIRRILEKHKLTITPRRKKKRIKYIRWQREHPNSLWQIDHSDQKVEGKWVVSIIDDCSRKSLAFVPVNKVTTDIVIKIIDNLIQLYGKPKQILTDNGGAYGIEE